MHSSALRPGNYTALLLYLQCTSFSVQCIAWKVHTRSHLGRLGHLELVLLLELVDPPALGEKVPAATGDRG